MSRGLSSLRVHDLKHTYGHRLRSAGIGFEDRQVLLGHKSRVRAQQGAASDLMVAREGLEPSTSAL